jgi:hypothetical protein
MTIKFDVAELSSELAGALSHPHAHRIAIVLPIMPGARQTVHDLLEEGPPFNLRDAGITSHEVLVSDQEAIFVFGLRDGPRSLERVLADEDFWTVVGPWEHLAAGPPRLAHVAYDWPER